MIVERRKHFAALRLNHLHSHAGNGRQKAGFGFGADKHIATPQPDLDNKLPTAFSLCRGFAFISCFQDAGQDE